MQSGIENNIIITEPSKNLRTLGRNALAGNWKVCILAVLVYTLIISIPQAILDALFGVNMADVMYNYGFDQGMDPSMYSAVYSAMPKHSSLSMIYVVLVSGPLQLGLCLFFLAMFRRQIVEVSDMFLGFERFGKALGLFLYQSLFIFLWMLLFIVPGIIAAIRYSQAFFILADDPEKGIRQCMQESIAMMKGNKMKYFCLQLSFIGWLLLAGIPNGVLQGMGQAFSSDGIISSIFTIIGGLFVIPVTVYIMSTQAGFYEILAGHLIKATEPAPIEQIAPTPAPSVPAAPVAPAAPGQEAPAAPAAPVQEAPAAPAAPAAPVQEAPAAPAAPAAPVQEAPAAPAAPAAPVQEAPAAPAAPAAPVQEAPAAPAAPAAPVQEAPAAPAAPETPAAPSTPLDTPSEE